MQCKVLANWITMSMDSVTAFTPLIFMLEEALDLGDVDVDKEQRQPTGVGRRPA